MEDIERLKLALVNADKAGDIEAATKIAQHLRSLEQVDTEEPQLQTSEQAEADMLAGQQQQAAQLAERRGGVSESLGRVGKAAFGEFAEPATEFTELREKYTKSPYETLNMLNSAILTGGETAVNALRALETLVMAPVRGGTQAIGEIAGEDPRDIERTQREVQEFVDVGLLPLAAKPSSFRATKGRVAPTGEAKQRILDEKSLPEPVPMTKGDISQELSAQAFEEQAAKGLRGEGAQAIVGSTREKQAEALRANIAAQQKQLSGQEIPLVPEQRGIGAGRAAGEVENLATAERKVISDAYDTARKTEANVEGKLINDFANDAELFLDESGFDIANSPALKSRLDDLKQFGDLTPNTVNEIQKLRKRMNKNIETLKRTDPSQANAIGQLKGKTDDFLDALVDEGLIKGSDEAVGAWKNAIDLRRRFGERFQSNKVIERITKGDLTQEDAASLLLGGTKMGFSKEAGRIVRDLKGLLGPTSEGFKALKEEAFLKLIRNQEKSGTFSGKKFDTAWQSMKTDNPTLVRELFTKNEINDINRIARVGLNVTQRVDGVQNFSNSANVLIKFMEGSGLLQRVFGSTIGALLKPAASIRAAGEAKRAVNIGEKLARIKPKNDLFIRAVILSQEQETQNGN